MKRALEMDGDGHLAVVHVLFAPQNASENFGLSVGLCWIVRKRDPQWHTDAVMFVAGEKKSAAGSVAGLALLDLLSKGHTPAKPDREAETYAAMQTSRHKSERQAAWLG